MEHLLFVAFVGCWSILAIRVFDNIKPKTIKLNKNTVRLTISAFRQLRK